MAKRKLVEIPPSYHAQFTSLRKHIKAKGGIVPSIPALVKLALDRSIPGIIKEFTGIGKPR